MREPGDRTMIRLPEECKEYLAIYTTEYDDSYVLETIVADDIVYQISDLYHVLCYDDSDTQ